MAVLAAATIAAGLWAAAAPTPELEGVWIVNAVSNPDGRLTRRAIAPGKTFQIDSSGRMAAEMEHFAGIVARKGVDGSFLLTDTATDETFAIKASPDYRTLTFSSGSGTDMFSARKRSR
jgi:hypothetical protein